MKRLVAVALFALLAASCGRQEPASPLDAMPETGMVQVVISDPAMLIANLDGYIEGGVPIAGPDLVAGLLLSATGCENMDSLAALTGIDIHGATIVYAAGVNPQGIGAAAQLVDADAFWAYFTELGAGWVEAEPIEGAVVKTIEGGDMPLTVATYRSVVLMAGSRAEILAMIDRIEGRAPHAAIAPQPGSMWIKADVTAFGPLVASQIDMYRSQILAGIQSEAGPGTELAGPMIELYLDAFDLLLTETQTIEYTLAFGPEMLDATGSMTFVPGSTLAGYLVPVTAMDFTSILPSEGLVMGGRFSIPQQFTADAMTAVLAALGAAMPQEYIDLSAQMSSNTAFAMYGDAPMHFAAVYAMPEGATMQDVRAWIEGSLGFASGILADMPGVTFSAPVDSTVDGVDYLTYSTVIDLSAMDPSVMGQPMQNMSFTAWLTQKDDMLLLEMAPVPTLLPAMVSGGVTGGSVAEIEYFAGAGADKEIVFAFELGGYMQMIMAWAGETEGLDALSANPAWIYYSVDLTDQGMVSNCTMSGSEVAGFIGNVIASSGAMNMQ
jgi:hypothetical protein